MENFFKNQIGLLKASALILMLVIPFLLYWAASNNSVGLVNFFLVLMGTNMLFIMLKG